MKALLVSSCATLLLAAGAFAQTPAAPAPPSIPPAATPFPTAALTVPPVATPAMAASPAITPSATPVPTFTPIPTPTATPGNSVTLTVTSSATPSADDEIDNAIEKKIRKHFSYDINGHHGNDEDAAWIALPIVFIVFLAIFGMPVLIVAVILYFSFSKNRAMHKTVRLMVEKGQPVPESLLNPPPIVRQRSDLRRGIKWMLVGIGVMIFLGACNDWEGGAWSLGIIPFLIGAGYIIFWRLDLSKEPVVREQTVVREETPPQV